MEEEETLENSAMYARIQMLCITSQSLAFNLLSYALLVTCARVTIVLPLATPVKSALMIGKLAVRVGALINAIL